MEFKERKVEFPNRRILTKLDENGQPLGETIVVDIDKLENEVVIENQYGTPISAENLNKGNWRDDESISFVQKSDDTLPEPMSGVTQIVTTATGETWLIAPLGRDNIRLDKTTCTTITDDGVPLNDWEANVKQNKIDNLLQTNNKQVVPAINEVLYAVNSKLAYNATAVNSAKLGGYEANDFATSASLSAQADIVNAHASTINTQQINLNTQQTTLNNHVGNLSIHVTTEDKTNWNGKASMITQSSIPTNLADNTICFVV